ncbi:restriction endonuclease [Thiocystis violacea]|uniref:restriction endonuclease n=1 Tax=Thiocystis violacea TaxID=13725 RepID=UPI001907FB11|nr:restriction endonuclease [Thiocystis violacea]MBK1717334.1 hypothetical protein [Thiocystis violacea]
MGRRHRNSDMEHWIDAASILPWWAALTLAVMSYALLHWLAASPTPQVTNPHDLSGPIIAQMLRTGALIGQYLLPFVFGLGAIVSVLKARRNTRLLAQAKSTLGNDDLKSLSWQDFEHLVGETFRERGFSVTETRSGPDGGVDLELRKDSELHLVQCKRWRARSVGVEIVRELYGVMAARGAVGGYVVSSGTFSQEARQFAAGRNIELWDGPKLKAMIHATGRRSPGSAAIPAAKRAPEGAGIKQDAGMTAPVCPTCGAAMVLRTAKRGVEAGKPFWGCSTFPKCRGTRPHAAERA